MHVGRLKFRLNYFSSGTRICTFWSMDFCWYVDWMNRNYAGFSVGRVLHHCVLNCFSFIGHWQLPSVGFWGTLRASEYDRYLLFLYFLNVWDTPLSSILLVCTQFWGSPVCQTLSSVLVILRSFLWYVGQGITGLSAISKHGTRFPNHKPEGCISLTRARAHKGDIRQKYRAFLPSCII